MSPKQHNWLALHLLHPEGLKQSAMKKKPRTERGGSEECFLIVPEIPVLAVKTDSIGEFEAGNPLGIGKSSNLIGEFEADNPLGVGKSSNSIEEFEAGNPLRIDKSGNSVEEFKVGNACVQPVSFSFVSSPFPLISLFAPIHHSVTQHYYHRLSPEESAIFDFNTYILPRERRQRKEFLQ